MPDRGRLRVVELLEVTQAEDLAVERLEPVHRAVKPLADLPRTRRGSAT
jgi:hypothetical protein